MDTKEELKDKAEAATSVEEEADQKPTPKPKSKVRTRDVTKKPPPEPSDEDAEAEEPEPESSEAETEAEAEKPKADEPERKRSWRRDPLILVALAITVIAGLAAAWFGWSYHSASNDKGINQARMRDDVLRSAEQEVVNLNTLDYTKIDQGLSLWQDSTTADLYNQIVQGRQQLAASITKAKTVSTAKILESGITELDSDAGKAGVMVAIRVTVTTPDGKSSTTTRRLSGQLTRTSDGWRLSALGQAATSSGN
ncbi:hypothetical protein [Actinomadura oligospora]|uniref:hypothetical protein n=1 Tax=Actinomadura oligospora TaxID=111804 RepID=UPI0004B4D3E1|nr:hypothetical protein [Actinomadura oligospora]